MVFPKPKLVKILIFFIRQVKTKRIEVAIATLILLVLTCLD